MRAWHINLGIGGSKTELLLGDPSGAFTKACGMELTHPGPASVGIIGRCKRFAMHVENNVVQYVAVSEAEDDPAGDKHPEATCAPAMIEAIKAAAAANSKDSDPLEA
mmetsp:Transcript_13233/g.18740  ORF Transcript_13233/g.18740 Transcript_13233/m.18740 type:complete len:107 (-) Transcript_13233:371-691(-)